MKNWKDRINDEIKGLINLDLFAELYLAKILNNINEGCPKRFAIRKAKDELLIILLKFGIKPYEIIHLLHSCGIIIYPDMYDGCGCHNRPVKQYNKDHEIPRKIPFGIEREVEFIRARSIGNGHGAIERKVEGL